MEITKESARQIAEIVTSLAGFDAPAFRAAVLSLLPDRERTHDGDYDCGAIVLRVVRGDIVHAFLPDCGQWIATEINRAAWVTEARRLVRAMRDPIELPVGEDGYCLGFFSLRGRIDVAIDVARIWATTAREYRAVEVPLLRPLTKSVYLGKGTCTAKPPPNAIAYRGGGESSYVVFYTAHGKATAYRVGGSGGRPECVRTSLTSLRHKYAGVHKFEDTRLMFYTVNAQ
jgi:hypothetical protein